MKHTKSNQSGFSAIVVVLLVAVSGIIGLVTWRVVGTDTNKAVNRQTDTTATSQLSPLDAATLAQAKELKKVDFDLDGIVNSKDNDDDNDGQNDEVDKDDDNDGVDDEKDDDDDNDDVDDDKDDEDAQEAELQESDDTSDSDNNSDNNSGSDRN